MPNYNKVPTPMVCHVNNLLVKYLGNYLCMSIIISTFVLSMIKFDDGFEGGQLLAEGRLQPAYIFI